MIGESTALIVKNRLHMSSAEYNLMPPFMLSEVRAEVKPDLKTCAGDLSPEDHSLRFNEEDFRIPFDLCGAFSYFLYAIPSSSTLNDPKKEIFISHLTVYGACASLLTLKTRRAS